MLSVAEIMTREPYTLGPDDTLVQARQLMAEHHIRHIHYHYQNPQIFSNLVQDLQ